MEDLEKYFEPFRKNIIGHNATYETPYGKQKVRYFDWIAGGRLYQPIEDKISGVFGPYIANTHTETSETGSRMTYAYHWAQKLIKEHVNAGPNDVIINAGSGMTTVVNKLQRILGMKGCNRSEVRNCHPKKERPVVFLTHMEHHSNQTSWYETIADVVVLEPDEHLMVDPEELRREVVKYADRPFKIGSFTACSNVTGIMPAVHELSRIMHENGGICFVDYAASAPYVDINMHPEDPLEKLDAIFFSPHKFLGGPGSSGVMIFDSSLYKSEVPDNPGGGTVDWTNPWGNYKYVDDIEAREDGGTPGFLQAIRTALAIELKNQMGTERIHRRENELVQLVFPLLKEIPGVRILADNEVERLGILSFYIPDVHYNLIVRLLSDRFGIQVRGGCACAGTYGHYLLEVSHEMSRKITDLINHGDLSAKPGWVRMSLHPTVTNEEVHYFAGALRQIVENLDEWSKDYIYSKRKNEFVHHSNHGETIDLVKEWFLF